MNFKVVGLFKKKNYCGLHSFIHFLCYVSEEFNIYDCIVFNLKVYKISIFNKINKFGNNK